MLLHENTSGASVAWARAYIFGIWLLKIALEPTHQLSYMPRELYGSLGVLRTMPQLASEVLAYPAALQTLKLLLVVLLAMVVIGVHRKPAQVAACGLLLIHQGVVRGYTRVNHAEMGLLYVTLVLTVFDLVGRRRRSPAALQRGTENVHAVTLQSLALVFCMTYCFTGAHRLVRSGGHEFFTSYTTAYWLVRAAFMPNDYQFAYGRMALEYLDATVVLNMSFALATVFEILAPFCLVTTIFRRLWIAAMLSMHVAIMLTMKFLFWENCLLMLILVNYHAWVPQWRFNAISDGGVRTAAVVDRLTSRVRWLSTFVARVVVGRRWDLRDGKNRELARAAGSVDADRGTMIETNRTGI